MVQNPPQGMTRVIPYLFYNDVASDIEGHHWTFAQHIKDVPPEEMQPPTGT